MNPFVDRLFEAWTDATDPTPMEDRFAPLYTDPVRVNGSNPVGLAAVRPRD